MRGKGRVFPVERVRDVEKHADELRGHLTAAGVTRAELHNGTTTVRPFDVRSFRTCFATWCARSGFDSAWIDAWLGHAPKTTAAKHYVKDTGAMTSGVFPELPAALLRRSGPRTGPSGSKSMKLQCEGRDLKPDGQRHDSSSDAGLDDRKSTPETPSKPHAQPIPAIVDQPTFEPTVPVEFERPESKPSRGDLRISIASFAAKARLLERLLVGDERTLATELREGLEAPTGPVAEIVRLDPSRRKK
jgi:hypothetical protein